MKFCTHCGAEMEDAMRFCTKCGKPYADGGVNPPSAGRAAPEPAAAQPGGAVPTLFHSNMRYVSDVYGNAEGTLRYADGLFILYQKSMLVRAAFGGIVSAVADGNEKLRFTCADILDWSVKARTFKKEVGIRFKNGHYVSIIVGESDYEKLTAVLRAGCTPSAPGPAAAPWQTAQPKPQQAAPRPAAQQAPQQTAPRQTPGAVAIQGVTGEQAGKRFAISSNVTIGRGPECGIGFALDAQGVSRQHCMLVADGGNLFVRDLGSTYGTYVNGSRLPANQSVPLKAGDRIFIGSDQQSFTVIA